MISAVCRRSLRERTYDRGAIGESGPELILRDVFISRNRQVGSACPKKLVGRLTIFRECDYGNALRSELSMNHEALLRKWVSLDQGNGLARTKRVSRILTVTSFALFVITFLGATYWSFPRLALIACAIPAGWLIAERNALDGRMRNWTVMKQYIDWGRVHHDLQTGRGSPHRQ